MEQVHSGASPTASAPAGILFVGREMPEVSRPPVPNLKVPFDSKGYTHTPPRREACVASILPGKEARHMCTQKGQMKMKRTRQTKVCVVADEEEPSEEGQPMNQTSL